MKVERLRNRRAFRDISLASLVVLVLSASSGRLAASWAAGLREEMEDGFELSIDTPHSLASGEVVAVDRASGAITVRCRPIPELHIAETTTMIFHVVDKSLLEGLTPGDRIRFSAERGSTGPVIVKLEHSN